jgi:hypothetical protein
MPQGRLVNTISPVGNQLVQDLVVRVHPLFELLIELVVDHQFGGVRKRAAGHPFGAPRITKSRDWRERLYWAAV